MDNSSFTKIQNDFKKSNAIIIKNVDVNNKFLDDISDSDNDTYSYRKRNNNIINKLNTKNNDNISLSNKSIKKTNIKKKEYKKEDVKEENNKDDVEADAEYNSDEEVEDEMEYEFQEDFEDKVKLYVKTDDQIRELQKQIKELNTSKKNTEEGILKHLERLGENNINITGGKLRINKYESKEGFKEVLVKEVITEKIKDPKIVETILEKISEKRNENTKVQISLKRTYERAKGK